MKREVKARLIRDKKEDYISITDLAYAIDRSPTTIKRWYKWWENPEFEKPKDLQLPEYYYLDAKRTKYFRVSDIPILEDFKIKLATTHKGCMNLFCMAYQDGKRGKSRIKRAGKDPKEILGMLK